MNILESISGYDFVVVDGYGYFSNIFYNGFFKVELETGKTIFLGGFTKEKVSEMNIHLEIMLEDDRIYFFPRRGYHMYIYHLSDETMQAVKVRDDSEPFFIIEEVVIENDYVYFLPEQKNDPIKKMERNTYEITNLSTILTIQGKYLSKCRKIIPDIIIENYHIQHGSQISCKKMSDGKYYCFMPTGRQLLRFTEGTYNLETIPLTVLNETELQKHLYKVKQQLFKARLFFSEFEDFRFHDFLEPMILSDGHGSNRYEGKNRYSVGELIWKTMEE